MKAYAVALGVGLEQCYFIELAKKLGFRIIGFDKNPQAIGAGLCDEFYPISTSSTKQIICLLERYKPSLVIPSPIGSSLITAGAINEHFHIESFGFNSALTLTDKSKFYKFLTELGLNSIQTWTVPNVNYLFSIINSLTFPLVIKPVKGSGSRGVLVIADQFALEQNQHYLQTNSNLFEDGLLIQEYILGTNLGADGLFCAGKLVDVTVRYKFVVPPPFRSEYAYLAPYNLENSTMQNLIKIFQTILDKIGVKSCVFHCDIILSDKNELFILEFSLRPSGMNISSKLLPDYLGINYARDFMIFIKEGSLHLPSTMISKNSIKDTFVIEHLYNPSFEGKVMLSPTLEEMYNLEYIQEIGFEVNSPIKFVHPTTNYDILKNGYVLFKSSLYDVASCRVNFYNTFKEVRRYGNI